MNIESSAAHFHLIAFTKSGKTLRDCLSKGINHKTYYEKNDDTSLDQFVSSVFHAHLTSRREVLVFIGATGIAVRAIAPYVGTSTKILQWWS